MKRKILICVLAVAMLVTMLAGCGTANKAAGDNDKAAGKPVKDSLTIAMLADIGSLDPITSVRSANAAVYENIYNTLVGIDGSGKIVPDLAENWTISDDGLTYTFNLKKGVKFHNGEELKTKDAVYTLSTCKKSPYMATYVADIKEITAIDDYSFKIVLNAPSAAFLLNLRLMPVLNEKAVNDAAGKYGQDNAIGTGAYKFVKHDIGQSVTLERNEDYFGTKPQIKTIEYKVITDPNSALVALQSGDVDLMESVPASSLNTIRNDANLTLQDAKGLGGDYLLLNLTKKPFDNVLVRQALSYAIDKEAVVQMAKNGAATKAVSFINKNTFGFSDKVKGYDYNPEKAKELLAKAGYPNGFKVTLKCIDSEQKKIAEVVQENLGKVGITVKIELGEQNAAVADFMSGNFEMGTLAIGLLADIDFWSVVLTSTGAYNIGKYKSPKVDELFAQGKKLLNENDRLEVYEQLLQIINDDVPFVPICHPTNYFAMNKDLKVSFIEPNGILKFENMTWVVK